MNCFHFSNPSMSQQGCLLAMILQQHIVQHLPNQSQWELYGKNSEMFSRNLLRYWVLKRLLKTEFNNGHMGSFSPKQCFTIKKDLLINTSTSFIAKKKGQKNNLLKTGTNSFFGGWNKKSREPGLEMNKKSGSWFIYIAHL